jgi:drug/metabolite transporter (DMT)-like permease
MGWSAVIFLAIVCQVMGQGLLTYSLKQFSSGLVAVSMLTIPVLAAILAMLVFSEKLSLLNWLAFLVVLTGIYLAVSAQNVEKESLLKN